MSSAKLTTRAMRSAEGLFGKGHDGLVIFRPGHVEHLVDGFAARSFDVARDLLELVLAARPPARGRSLIDLEDRRGIIKDGFENLTRYPFGGSTLTQRTRVLLKGGFDV